MTYATNRRPLPALVFLLALTVLTSLVWWRVLHRTDGGSVADRPCVPSPSQRVLPRPETITVSVLNSTAHTGLAKSAAAVLTKDGFQVSRFGNDTGHPTIKGVAEIRYTPDQRDQAAMLAYYLPGATLVAATATDSSLVVSLGAKFKTVAAVTAVHAQMTRDKVSAAPSGTQRQPASPSPSC